MRLTASLVILSLAAVAGCSREEPAVSEPPAPATAAVNPLFAPSTLPYGMPPFDRIRNEHYAPAFELGMAEERAEINLIADNPEPPTFENTILAMERTGRTLDRVGRIFFNIVGAHTNDTLDAVNREVSQQQAAHNDATFLNAALFARIEALYEQRADLGLDAESLRLLERYHRNFVRAGAKLTPEQQDRLRVINTELARLGTEFSQRVLAEVNASAVVVDTAEELDGLTDAQVRTAAAEAVSRGLDGKYVITLLNTSGQPPLSALTNRAVRERVHKASLARGTRGNEHDTTGVITEVVKLRAERARMLGYDTHADYTLDVVTAGSTGAVNSMLGDLGPVAVANARKEGAELQRIINATEPERFKLASWDWAFYTEQVRKEKFDVDASAVRPFFELDNVLVNGVFHSANKLFGVTFVRRDDLPVYHPDVQVWEVFEADGSPLGIMYADFYARSSKRGGAWMNSYVVKSGLLGGNPVTGNHLNIPKPPAGEPTLMTWDEVTTLFHEFGHVIHGLFSDVHYPTFAATAVPRDFVEYPSQVYEMWADWPEILENYALHYQTGERIPQELLDRVMAAEQFNEGFRSTEYLAASIIDQALHQLPLEEIPSAGELMAFEAQVLRDSGMHYPPVPPRYKFPYFSHLFTHAYSAGYYSYIWSEVLDADSVEWFKENGGLTRANGQHYRDTILSKGGSIDAMELYRMFAGRDASREALLIRRGLTTPAD